MLYTRVGDSGTTKLYGQKNGSFGCDQRISKSATATEALGSLDEANSFLGLCKVQSAYLNFKFAETSLSEIVHEMQKNLFVIQAEIAGADKSVEERKIKELEEIIDGIEMELPPIKSFFIAGGPTDLTKWQEAGAGLGALFDIARTIIRRAERRIVALTEEMAQPKLSETDASKEEAGTEESSLLNKKTNISSHTLAYLNRLSSALYALARYANHKVGIIEEAPDYR